MVKKHAHAPKAPDKIALEVQVSKFLESKARPVLLPVLVVIVVAVLVGVVYIAVSGQRQEKLAQGFAALNQAGQDVDALQEVAQEHAGTAIGGEATLRLARQYMQTRDYAKALAQFDSVIANYADSYVAQLAQLGRAYALEATGELAGAEQAFLAVAEQSRGDADQTAEAYIGAARANLTRGNLDQAEAHYKNALAATPAQLYEQRAQRMLEEIQARRRTPTAAATEPAPAAPEQQPAAAAEPQP